MTPLLAIVIFCAGLLATAGGIVAAAIIAHAPEFVRSVWLAVRRKRNRKRTEPYNLARTMLRRGSLRRVA